jgi:hypothetical protein
MRVAVRVWPWVLAVVVLAPVLAPGYVLSYDMVFVPDLALRSDFLGLGSSLPRAVPSDAVVAVVDEVVPGMVLQKLVLLAALVLAGVGARRLVPTESGVAQLAATSLYVWNPYVAERLGIGHWPLLLAYAALPWVFDAARRARAGERGALPALVLWLALAALSAAGGLMAAAVALVFVGGRGREALHRTVLVGGAALAVNAPWLVAGLLHGRGALTDPAAVEAFAARGEGLLPLPLTLLGLGGIWNAEVVPASRDGWVPVFALVATFAVCLVGVRAWLRWLPRRDSRALVGLALSGLVVASVGALTPGLMEWFVSSVPGGGLLRDGSRFLALVAPLQAGLFGVGAGVLASVMREQVGNVALAAGAVLLPLAAMPDLAWGLAGSLRPVQFPEEYAEARDALEQQTADRRDGGAVLVLPFTSYRVPPWNEGRRTLDPLGRYLTPDYVAADDLYVSGNRIQGEDSRARRVAEVLAGGVPGDSESTLRAEGIAWVALDQQALEALQRPGQTPPDVRAADLTLPGRGSSVYSGDHVEVWELPGEVAAPSGGRANVVLIASAWVGASGVVLICALALARPRRRLGLKDP